MIHEKTTRKRQENRSMKIENRTPHQDGFYMPGEFEPQDGAVSYTHLTLPTTSRV